jgi:hypothetical protein
LGKKFYNSLKFGPTFFRQQFKNKIIFFEICGYKKGMTTNFFPPLSFVAVLEPGSGKGKNQDPGSEMGKNQDPGSGINVRNI